MDYYYSHITKRINLDRALDSYEKCCLYLKRLRNEIVLPLITEIKNNNPESKLMGLVAISLQFDGRSPGTSAVSLPGLPLLSKSKLEAYAGKRHFLRYLRENIGENKQFSVAALSKQLIRTNELCLDYDRVFSDPKSSFLHSSHFFNRSKNTPSDENLKKLSIPSALIFIYNIVETFDIDDEKVKAVHDDCVELFQAFTYAAYKLRAFECAGQRNDDFELNLQAVEIKSKVSFVQQ